MSLPISTTGVGSTPTFKPSPISGGGSVLGLLGSISTFSSVLAPLLSGEVIGKTIGQALKDGIDCWGSTWTPTRAEQDLPAWYARIAAEFERSLDVDRSKLQGSVNTFFKTFWGNVHEDYDHAKTLAGWIGWRYDSARDCTLRGLIALEKGIDEYLKQIVAIFPDIAKEINADISVSYTSVTLYRDPQSKKNKPYTKRIPQITVKLKQTVVDVVADDVQDYVSEEPAKAGFGGLGMLLLLGAGWYVYKNKNMFK